jgi:hypothetical protein
VSRRAPRARRSAHPPIRQPLRSGVAREAGTCTKYLADLYELAPLDWDDVRARPATNITQEPGSGGPDHHTFWLSTLDADGRPHMTAVGAFWIN